MGSTLKIGVIGAGSAQFAAGLISDLCTMPSLAGTTVHLMDLDIDRLQLVGRVAARIVGESGADIQFTASTSREEAIDGATFVVNTAAPSHHDDEADRALGEAHGYYRGVRLNAYRNLALMLSIARDVERRSPRAWLIQQSNPVFDGTTLLTRETGVQVVGLCHGFAGYRKIARALGFEPDEVDAVSIGVNHSIWAVRLAHRGTDLYPALDQWIADVAPAYWASRTEDDAEVQLSPAAVRLYRLLGMMPIGDTVRHTGWEHQVDLATKQRWFGPLGGFDSEAGWQRYLGRLDRALAAMRAAVDDPSTPIMDRIGDWIGAEQTVGVIDALANDHRGTFQVNVRNDGALPGIAADVAVELPALVDGAGIHPIARPPLPALLMLHVIAPKILEMERHLAALLGRDRRMLLSSLLWDQRTTNAEQAEAFLAALLDQPHNREMRAGLVPAPWRP